ncbi:hypothetical protein [Fictibacillus barbaricus]|uniref:Uncharacterized protein n=1 Tax=Fictibacillus barbaricus TaxID=182136 RepID=A0ABU1U266_9BACL|nr:hypothetical protein [Fictibacillus barbaricus]MDR7073577.1 hypothetical protein [Fictibacillus barbaricus]
MSDYQDYMLEREKMDYMMEKGYKIKDVMENLSGAFVQFEKSKDDAVTIHIKTADGRKYFSNLILLQNRSV